jgi:AraC-like DNA-binding protein
MVAIDMRLQSTDDVAIPTETWRMSQGSSSENTLCRYWAEKGKQLIFERYTTLKGVEEVCSILGISSSHFRESFQYAYGMSPKSYLDNLRIEEAKRLLADHGNSVDGLTTLQVAKSVGFRNTSTFRRTFRKIVGVSPSEFQKER